MKDIHLKDLAKELSAQADFDISEREARAFIKKALTQTMEIVKKSKGKIMFRNCDLLQCYKRIDYQGLKDSRRDVNETQDKRDGLWPYKV